MFAFGDYGGDSYLDIEMPGNVIQFFRTPAQGDNIASSAEIGEATFPGDVPVFVTIVRLGGQLRMTANGQTVVGPVASPEPVTGRLGLLNNSGDSYGWIYSRMDNFKLTKGGAEYKTFPFTPPTT